jgi:peptidoglycan pentaglycine glycine transferase (the first glycine)
MLAHETRESAGDWQSFLDNQHKQAHLLQTAAWGELKRAHGWSSAFVRAGDAGAMMLVRALPLGLKLAYIPKGPVGRWTPDLVERLDRACHDAGAFALKVEPDAVESDALSETMAQFGFTPSPHTIQPRQTLIIDISDDDEEILGRMHQKTRYNIRLSGRKGIVVRPWSDLEAFGQMMHSTADRQDFGAHTTGYYKRAYELFHPDGLCEVFVAAYEGEPLAALMAFARGDRAWYFYGASTPRERNRMPTYALQWAAIQWAKERGCTSYDLWGIPDAPESQLEAEFTDRSDGLWGVYRFKRGFGGELARFGGAWDRVQQPAVYALYRLYTRLRLSDG